MAAHAANNLHRHVLQRPEYKEGDIEEAIKQGFLECDRAMRTAESLKEEMAGCTAITVFVRGKELWCANAGDSRCVAGVGGVARPLSTDHKPMVRTERPPTASHHSSCCRMRRRDRGLRLPAGLWSSTESTGTWLCLELSETSSSK